MNILFIGDIIGKTGRRTVKKILADLKKELKIDFTIANGENLAGGLGMTKKTYEEMLEAGIDYFTTGNDIWCKEEFIPCLDDKETRVLRPVNYVAKKPGRGLVAVKVKGHSLTLINLMGRVFIKEELENPFLVINKILSKIKKTHHEIILIDFHAEATSEKNALAWYLDGRVTAVIGTHTHIPTADSRILPKGTAYITDVGMVGALNSCIGAEFKSVIDTFLADSPLRIKPAGGEAIFNAALIKVDQSGQAKNIELITKIIQ